jgi:hypothetical protein
MPMNVAAKPEPGIDTNGELKPVARAFASIVLPVPGGPKNNTPRSRLPPWRSNCSPDCQIETTRRTSSFASACPRTSSSLTPHCASPGSKVLICVMFIASSGPKRIPKLAMKRKKTKTTWIQSAGDDRIVPMPSRMKPIVPHQVPPRNSQTMVIRTKKKTKTLNQKRQNQARRRPTTSSSRSSRLSIPNRLGFGISLRKSRSAIPRKTTTIATVAISAFHQTQSFRCVSQT